MFRSINQGHIQFVAQKQDNHMSGQAPDSESRQVQSGDSNPWQSPAQPQQQQMPRAQQPPPPGLMQQQAAHWGPNGISQQSTRPLGAGPLQPLPGPGSASPAGMGSAAPHILGHPLAGPSGPMPGPPPRGPAIAWGGSPGGPPPPHMMGPGGRGMPPRGPPNGPPGMPPGMHPGMLGRGLPPGMHARPPPGMRPPGVMQGFPGGGPPPGFPPQRPPMATPPRPPQGWGQPEQGSPRLPQMMPHPMHRPPPQHPGGGPQQMHLLRPPANQQGSHLRPKPPQHPAPQQLPPQQLQQHLQSPGNMLSPRPGHMASPGPQAVPQARPTVPMQLNGMPARPVTQAPPLQQLEARSQPAMATHKPTTGGWMAHKSGDGQVTHCRICLAEFVKGPSAEQVCCSTSLHTYGDLMQTYIVTVSHCFRVAPAALRELSLHQCLGAGVLPQYIHRRVILAEA